MLQNAALLPLLLAPTVAAPEPTAPEPTANRPAARDLLAALPENTFLAVHAANPKALVAARESNDWIAFAMDPEWQAITGLLLSQIDENAMADEMEQWRQRLFRALGDSTGFVAFVGEGFGDGDPVLGILAEGGPDAAALLRTLVWSHSPTQVIEGGHEVVVSSAGRGELYYESNGLIMVLSTPTVESATRLASECLAAVDGPAPRGPFAVEGVVAERRPAALELAVDMSQLWSELERIETPTEGIQKQLFDAAASMEWMYGSVSFGEGEISDWEFVVPYGEETLLGGLLGHFGAADRDMLSNVPASATNGMAMVFDVSGCADWVMGLVRETSEEAHEEMQAGLSAVTEMAGIDVMGDVVHNMTGQFLYFAAPMEESDELFALTGMQSSTVIAGIEDTDPILDMIEILLDMSGMGAMVETESAPVQGDEDGMEIWRIDPGMGFEVVLGTGAGRLALSSDASGFEDYLAQIGGEDGAETLLSDPALAAAASTLSGSMISVQRTVAAAEAFQATMKNVESMLEDLSEVTGQGMVEIRPAMEAVDRIAVLMQQYFEGTVASELQIADGRIRYRTRTR